MKSALVQQRDFPPIPLLQSTKKKICVGFDLYGDVDGNTRERKVSNFV
jgi:hypothetical protein